MTDKRNKGYVALCRSVKDDWMYPTDEEKFTRFEAFCDLLMRAQGKPGGRRIKRGSQSIDIQRGELAVNLTRLAQEWGRGRKWVRTLIKTGENAGTWTQRKPEGVPNGTTIISFVNYDTYNPLTGSEDPTKGATGSRRGADGEQTGSRRGADQQGKNVQPGEEGKKETLGARRMREGKLGPQMSTQDHYKAIRMNAALEGWGNGYIRGTGAGPGVAPHDFVIEKLANGTASRLEIEYAVAIWIRGGWAAEDEHKPFKFLDRAAFLISEARRIINEKEAKGEDPEQLPST